MLVNREDMEIQYWVSIVNSALRFVSNTREFTNIAAKKSKLSLSKIHTILDYNSIIKKFAEVGNEAFMKFEHKLETILNELFNDIKDYKKFNLEEFTGGLFDLWSIITDHMIKNFASKIWKFIFTTFALNYSTLVVRLSTNYKPNELQQLGDKVTEDVAVIKNIFSALVPKKHFEVKCQSLDAIAAVWQAPNLEILKHITTLRLTLESDFNQESIKDILK